MSAPRLTLRGPRERLGLKGTRAGEWLAANGIAPPTAPNTWAQPAEPAASDSAAAGGLLIARLGSTEFFLEDDPAGVTLQRISALLDERPPGVYPVLREDWAFALAGERVHEVLAQVCNVNFAALALEPRPLIMTLMIGAAVLVVPQVVAAARGETGSLVGRRYLIWCDPTFGPYLGGSLGEVVIECGGAYTGVPE